MFIYDSSSNELQNPEYVLFQVWNESLDRWDVAKLYKIMAKLVNFMIN